jgi:hypothetical protein
MKFSMSVCVCRQEKIEGKLLAGVDQTLSPVRFVGKACEIAGVFSGHCNIAARFLCNQDCMAERVGFKIPIFTQTRMNAR